MTRAPGRRRLAASSASCCSCLGRRPGGGTIFAHGRVAGSRVAADGSFKHPMYAISWHHHVACQPDLIAMDRALHSAIVDLTLVIPGYGIAVLFQGEMLLAGAAGIMDA